MKDYFQSTTFFNRLSLYHFSIISSTYYLYRSNKIIHNVFDLEVFLILEIILTKTLFFCNQNLNCLILYSSIYFNKYSVKYV